MRFTRLVLAATGWGMLTAPLHAAQDKYLETIKVSDNVYVFKPKIDWTHGNGVAILGPDGVIFVDTYIQFNYAEEAIRRLKRLTRLPVKYVINTHSHDDHTTGNGVFRRHYPDSKLILQQGAVPPLETRVRAKIAGEAALIASNIAQTDSELTRGTTPDGTPLVGSMRTFDQLSLQDLKDYQKEFRQEQFVSPDITFSDTLTLRWGADTLRMTRVPQRAHSGTGDMILWMPRQRILISGDLVVAPTPYYNLPGITDAVRDLIAMNPAIVIPGHGPVMHDLSYLRLLERAFSTYQHAAQAALAANLPLRRAIETIHFPEIDTLFTGNDEMRKFAYTRFFTNNVFVTAYRTLPRTLALDSLPALQLANVRADTTTYLGRHALHLLPDPGAHDSAWRAENHGMVVLPNSSFTNGVIEAEVSGAPMSGARDGSRGFVGLAFHVAPNAPAYEVFYLRPTNGRADDQLRRNHSVQYMAWPDAMWDLLREKSPGRYEAYADIEPGVWTSIRIEVRGAKAQLYVNHSPQPVLVVNDLKLAGATGDIALWIGQDTEAYFSALTVTPRGG